MRFYECKKVYTQFIRYISESWAFKWAPSPCSWDWLTDPVRFVTRSLGRNLRITAQDKVNLPLNVSRSFAFKCRQRDLHFTLHKWTLILRKSLGSRSRLRAVVCNNHARCSYCTSVMPRCFLNIEQQSPQKAPLATQKALVSASSDH